MPKKQPSAAPTQTLSLNELKTLMKDFFDESSPKTKESLLQRIASTYQRLYSDIIASGGTSPKIFNVCEQKLFVFLQLLAEEDSQTSQSTSFHVETVIVDKILKAREEWKHKHWNATDEEFEIQPVEKALFKGVVDRWEKDVNSKGSGSEEDKRLLSGIDAQVYVTEVLLEKVLIEKATPKTMIEVFDLIQTMPLTSFRSQLLLFQVNILPKNHDGEGLGKRGYDKISKKTTATLREECRQNMNKLVTRALEVAQKSFKKMSNKDKAEFITRLNMELFKLMATPTLTSEFIVSCIKLDEENLQELALDSMISLMSRYNYEYRNYYEMLYNLVRKRKTLSIRMLKVIEISLRTRALGVSVLGPFLKVEFL